MAAHHQSRRFHGKPLLHPDYDPRDVPYCAKNLAGSTVSVVTERQHLVDSIAELTLLCNEANKRKKSDAATAAPSTKKTTKPLSIEYIFDRIDTDDPLWGLMVRTDEVMSFKGRASNVKASPRWKRGMLQGFITMTTFTNWQSSFRFDSLHEMAFGQDEDALEDQMNAGLRKFDEDGSLAEELEALVKGGNPHLEGIVYPRIAEISLLGGLGCGKQLLRLLVEHLETMKATARANYDFIVLQATENSIPFYEAMGFTRVGCVQGKAPSPDKYHSGPVEEYQTKKNGENPVSIAKEFGVDVWDLVFLNKPLYPELTQRSWLKMGTTIFVPKAPKASSASDAEVATQKWYVAEENETPRSIAKKFNVNFAELLEANRKRHPELVGHSKLLEGTRVQISCFHHNEEDTIAYSHWTFPEADNENEEPSYMMAMKLNRRKGNDAKARPVAESLAVPILPYSPEATGAKDLLLQPKPAMAPLAPVFTKKKQVKEPKKPKRPASSYMHFTKELRASMADEFEGMSLTEVNKIITEKWRALSDEEKAPYVDLFEESKAEYMAAMKVYHAEMKHFQRERESPLDSPHAGQVDDSLLEKVVKLKSTDGISGASKFEYFYVLTFIPDLQWVHLIPMRKVGEFGSEHPQGKGRPIWMIVSEDEGKEIDTIASMCEVVTALTLRNSEDADDEQWDIYDNGEKPPRLPGFSSKPSAASLSDDDMPDLPVRPKKPATSFAFFCGDAHTSMKKQLEGKQVAERSRILSEKWKRMTDEEKQPYKDRQAKMQAKYAKALQKYKDELAQFQRDNPDIDVSSLTVKTPGKKPKARAVSGSAKAGRTPKSTGQSGKKKRGRPRKHPDSEDGGVTPTPKPSRKRPLPESEEGNATAAPKRKKGRSRKSLLPEELAATSETEVKVHRVKKDPVVLENLLDKLKGGRVRAAGDGTSPFEGGDKDINLSMGSQIYREVMWRHFNTLGKARDGQREQEACDKAFAELKEKLGSEGHFFKRTTEIDLVLNDKKAREKIIGDIQKRVPTFSSWNGKTVDVKPQPTKKRPLPRTVSQDPPAKINVALARSKLAPGSIVLSLLDDEYKEIMLTHFKKLGRLERGQPGDEEESREIFEALKQQMGKGGKFFKKGQHDNDLYEVDDDVALKKILRDLKSRNRYADQWKITLPVVARPRRTPTKTSHEPSSLARSEVPNELAMAEEGCKRCLKDEDHPNLLLCEGCNDEYHTYCLGLKSVPEGDFFCDKCKDIESARSSVVVLSLADDQYKEIMYTHFRKLGKLERGQPGDEEASTEIFEALKQRMGKGGKFFKKGQFDSDVYEVSKEEALKKILQDLKSRNRYADKWLTSSPVAAKPRLSPTRSGGSETSAVVAEAKPRSTPSRYPQRGCPPELDGSKTDGLKQNAKAANSTRPLAPIFLKKYVKKQKAAPAEPPAAERPAAEEPEITPSKRYPSRRQEMTPGQVVDDIDDSHVVSDDGEPRKKRART